MKIKLIEYIVTMFGNKHTLPYGKIEVTNDEGETKVVKFEQEKYCRPSFTFNRKRYFMKNIGESLYRPKFILEEEK